MYDVREIAAKVRKQRKGLIIKFSITAFLMIVSLILIILNLNKTLTFICLVAELALLLVVYILFDKYSPRVCFSKELKGKNIKEEEYVTRKTPGPGLKWRQVGAPASPQPFAPNTGANKKRIPPRLRGKVYLQLENGDVVILSSLYKAHTDIFVEGDILLKYAGTQYPVVISRAVDRQPCPICGEINEMTEDSCKSCGLKIVKE